MELVHYVTNEEAELAKKMERKMLNLPLASGVLFAGVSVDKKKDAPPIYRVWIGCSRKIDPRAIDQVVQVTLYEEVKAGHKIETECRMGSIRRG